MEEVLKNLFDGRATPEQRETVRRSVVIPPRCGHCSGPHKTENGYLHDDTCPAMVSLEEVCAQDRLFFERHPRAGHYYRPITMAESSELNAATKPAREGIWVGQVKVTLLRPGVRSRDFSRCKFLPA